MAISSSRSAERLRESCEHDQIGVEPDALDTPHAECGEAEVMLQESELALDGGATTRSRLATGSNDYRRPNQLAM